MAWHGWPGAWPGMTWHGLAWSGSSALVDESMNNALVVASRVSLLALKCWLMRLWRWFNTDYSVRSIYAIYPM